MTARTLSADMPPYLGDKLHRLAESRKVSEEELLSSMLSKEADSQASRQNRYPRMGPEPESAPQNLHGVGGDHGMDVVN